MQALLWPLPKILCSLIDWFCTELKFDKFKENTLLFKILKFSIWIGPCYYSAYSKQWRWEQNTSIDFFPSKRINRKSKKNTSKSIKNDTNLQLYILIYQYKGYCSGNSSGFSEKVRLFFEFSCIYQWDWTWISATVRTATPKWHQESKSTYIKNIMSFKYLNPKS